MRCQPRRVGELAGDPTPKVTDFIFNQTTSFLFTFPILGPGDQRKGRMAPCTGSLGGGRNRERCCHTCTWCCGERPPFSRLYHQPICCCFRTARKHFPAFSEVLHVPPASSTTAHGPLPRVCWELGCASAGSWLYRHFPRAVSTGSWGWVEAWWPCPTSCPRSSCLPLAGV